MTNCATPMTNFHGDAMTSKIASAVAQAERPALAPFRRAMGQHVKGGSAPEPFPIGGMKALGDLEHTLGSSPGSHPQGIAPPSMAPLFQPCDRDFDEVGRA